MVIERNVQSVEEALRAVCDLRASWRQSPAALEEIWFRGVTRRTHGLLPGFYRPDVLALNYDEASMFERFKALAVPLVSREPANDWEWYFLAQHHHLRTRLLDWTENLLAAIHFALYEHIKGLSEVSLALKISKPLEPATYDDMSPAVWTMDAGTLNMTTCGIDCDHVFVAGSDGGKQMFTSRCRRAASKRQ